MSDQPARTSATADARSAPGHQTGDVLGDRYRLEAPVATGGMATVWRATDTVLTRPVAVKILHARLAADPDFVARFRREAVAAARLAHPSIVAVYDTCADPEAIVMELVDGRTLRAELDSRRFLPAAEAIEVASGIAGALDVAHKAGIVHRDVKPANVLLSADGRIKVTDFGIAKAVRSLGGPPGSAGDDGVDDLPDVTTVGSMVGTAKYLAPEQVSGGDVDARTDVYALGAVLYEMLCGRPPFEGDNDLATATARLHGPPPRPRSVLRTIPERLDRVVMRALASEPGARYESAGAMWADLQAAMGAERAAPAPTTDATAVADAPSFARAERSWLVPALLVSVVAVALGLAWLLIGGEDARRDLADLVDRVAPGGGASAAQVEGVVASAFDPVDPVTGNGGDGENDGQAGSAVDGNPDTAWSTERYETRDLGGLKGGVGLQLDLGASLELDELEVTTPDADWSATIHVADSPADDHAGWGEPVANIDAGSAGTSKIDLSDARGSYVLFWVTDLGDDGEYRFDAQELSIRAR